jgi:hypothetical protein
MSIADDEDRIITTDSYGRKTIRRNRTRKQLGFIRMFYYNRVLEWVNIRRLFQEVLMLFHFSHLCPVLQDITFCWSYAEAISATFYKPSAVFKKFSFVHLLDVNE